MIRYDLNPPKNQESENKKKRKEHEFGEKNKNWSGASLPLQLNEPLLFAFVHMDDQYQEVMAFVQIIHPVTQAMLSSCCYSICSRRTVLLYPVKRYSKLKSYMFVIIGNQFIEHMLLQVKPTLTCFNIPSSEMRDASLASSAAVEGLGIGEPPSSKVSRAESLLICCNI